MDLAGQLRELRGDMTQTELGDMLGVSIALISSWENERAVPPEWRLAGYAAIFRPHGPDELLNDLLALRDQVVKLGKRGQVDVLEDIRSLLAEILERLDRAA